MNVVPLAPKVEVAPDPELISMLKEMLTDAEAGKLVEFVCVYKDNNGERGHVLSPTDDLTGEIGAVARLLHLLNVSMDEMQNDG